MYVLKLDVSFRRLRFPFVVFGMAIENPLTPEPLRGSGRSAAGHPANQPSRGSAQGQGSPGFPPWPRRLQTRENRHPMSGGNL